MWPIEDKRFDQLTTRELYAVLRLRVDVFVVEQSCPYPELDDRDLEPATRHLWVRADSGMSVDDDRVAAYLRVMADDDGWRIGRVATGSNWRGRGLAAHLLAYALDTSPGPVMLSSQSYLTGLYAGFGFRPVGPEFLEDNIPHVPMRLERPSASG